MAAEHPLSRAEKARLHRLSVAEVATLLVALGWPADLADVLAGRAVTVTGGEPLLTRFVVEDVVAGNEAVLDGLERDPPAGVKDYFARQFRQLETRAAGETAWKVLGVLLVARTALSAEELAGVLGMPLREISGAIEPVRRFLLGRDRLELMHVELRAVVAEQFSPTEQQVHRRRLLAWCRRMSESDPPEGIPDYVLSQYAAHLQEARNHQDLYRLISRRWMDARAAQTHSHRAFAQDVLLMVEAAGAERPPNLVEQLRGLLIHATLASRATDVPPRALGVLGAGNGSRRASAGRGRGAAKGLAAVAYAEIRGRDVGSGRAL